MTETTKTSGARHIEQLMQQLPPDSERYRVLASARQFKSSWVELGEWLARVSNSNQFSDWGYTTFEDYCTREVRIRRKTAEKLLLAYRFLERKEPGLIERKAGHPLPDYRSVDLLRQADEERPFSMAEYAELRAVGYRARAQPPDGRQTVPRHGPSPPAGEKNLPPVPQRPDGGKTPVDQPAGDPRCPA